MSHPEQQAFCKRMRDKYAHLFQNSVVLDIGSRDFNGNNASLFLNCTYLGCDSVAGPNVTIVSRCHEIKLDPFSVDFIISTEMLEHDQYRKLSCMKMVELLKVGGHLLITCATHGRPPHGVDAYSGGDPYYENVGRDVLLDELGPLMHAMEVEVRSEAPFDLYYFGRKV